MSWDHGPGSTNPKPVKDEDKVIPDVQGAGEVHSVEDIVKRVASVKDGCCIDVLEINVHSSPAHLQVGPGSEYIGTNNIGQFADALVATKKLCSAKGLRSLIIITGCTAGNRKEPYLQKLADRTGATVVASMGFSTGTVLGHNVSITATDNKGLTLYGAIDALSWDKDSKDRFKNANYNSLDNKWRQFGP